MERYGVRQALYVDWRNLYQRCATPGERLRGEEPIRQFGRRCAKLGIELLAANSPQAAGRRGADSLDRKAEGGAAGRLPLATGRPARGREASLRWDDGGQAALVGLALRFALRAPQGSAAGKANHKDKNKNQKKGTLLMR